LLRLAISFLNQLAGSALFSANRITALAPWISNVLR
jgi:hypothetical protein